MVFFFCIISGLTNIAETWTLTKPILQFQQQRMGKSILSIIWKGDVCQIDLMNKNE